MFFQPVAVWLSMFRIGTEHAAASIMTDIDTTTVINRIKVACRWACYFVQCEVLVGSWVLCACSVKLMQTAPGFDCGILLVVGSVLLSFIFRSSTTEKHLLSGEFARSLCRGTFCGLICVFLPDLQRPLGGYLFCLFLLSHLEPMLPRVG